MGTLPHWLRWTHIAFNVSALLGGAFGLLYIWSPPDNEAVGKTFGSVLVVFAVTGVVLAGYRTIHLRSDHR
jgi:hypothetical protein